MFNYEHGDSHLNTFNTLVIMSIMTCLIFWGFSVAKIDRMSNQMEAMQSTINQYEEFFSTLRTSEENPQNFLTSHNYSTEFEEMHINVKDMHVTADNFSLAPKDVADASTSTGSDITEGTNDNVPADETAPPVEETPTESAPPDTTPEKNPIHIEDTGVYGDSGLNADQLNSLIACALDRYNIDDSHYLASGKGSVFKDAENKYGVNALYLIAISQRESGFKTSSNAKKKNNIMSIFKSDGTMKTYETVDDCIMDTARILGELYRDSWGETDITGVGSHFNPVNPEWSNRIVASVNTYIQLANDGLSE